MKLLTVTITSLILALLVTGCAKRLPIEERIASWDDWRLCHHLAQYVFGGNSQWLWHVSEEISKRDLKNNKQCKTVYDSRLNALLRSQNKSDISITFGEALNTNYSFEEATTK